MLAGDGGKGKTSIAYAFASDFAVKHPVGFQQVIWLTAKTKQFSGLLDDYVTLPESHFNSVDSLLNALAQQCGVTATELADTPLVTLKKLCKDALEVLPALVVVDDVDSLETDDQKRVMEVATQIASARSKFLLTTRANVTYSSEMCVTVPGLPLPEYKQFVQSLGERLGVGGLRNADTDRLHRVTDGSPLLTESILRLVRQGAGIEEAIKEWQGQAGEDARNAALGKELRSLSPEARRVLLCMSYLNECSLAEIRQLTSYGQAKLRSVITELQSLFLISAPVLTKTEPRFAVPQLVKSLVYERRTELAHDFHALLTAAKGLRTAVSVRDKGNVRIVGAAIAQASALLAQDSVDGAIETLKSALRQRPNQHNLQCMLARCYTKGNAPDLNQARDLFSAAYQGGNRRRELFDGWYEAEYAAAHWPGVVQVAQFALKEFPHNPDWYYRRGGGHFEIAVARERSGDSGALAMYQQAGEDLARSIEGSRGIIKAQRVEQARGLNDTLWLRASRIADLRARDRFEIVLKGIRFGDCRTIMYVRLFDCLERHLDSLDSIQEDSSTDISARLLLQQAEEALAIRRGTDARFAEQFETRADGLTSIYRTKLRKGLRR